MASRKSKKRHIPQRTCVGCREVLSKRDLIRIVRSADGVKNDPTGKEAGRGAYIHDQISCWETALQGALARALKVDLTNQERVELEHYYSQRKEEWEG